MNPESFMYIDGGLLIAVALICWTLRGEDPICEPVVPATIALFAGFVFFSQALFLFSSWVPSASGAPWWRALCDASLVGMFGTRLVQVFREKRRQKQRLAGFAAMKNPTLDVTVKLRSNR